MTTISIGTAFEKIGSADKGYPSKAFNKFRASLAGYQQRIENKFADATYPQGTALAGQPFDPANGTVNQYSANVMIPAFLNAYTVDGGNSLDIFPALTRLLPNWNVSYSGLSRLPRMKRIFKSFNINHGYKSVYSVGSYNTYTSYMEYMDGFGFVSDVATGNPIPSGMYDVSTVSINESFAPLAGVDMTFHNNLTAKVEYRKTRVLTLSMTSQQITETRSNDFVIGMGYKIVGLNLFGNQKSITAKEGAKAARRNKSGKPSRPGKQDEENKPGASKSRSTTNQGFSNDLNLRVDFSLRDQSALNRDILSGLTQATSGNKALHISFSADYALSKYLTLTAFYDYQFNKPLLTTSSYPTRTQDFGVSLRFILNR